MSDSEGAPNNLPDTKTLETALRDTVFSVRRDATDFAELTVNIARTKTEERLGLPEGYFKSKPEWKTKSKDIIQTAVNADEKEIWDEASASKPGPKKTRDPPRAKQGVKRASPIVAAKFSKRQKKAVADSEESGLSSAPSENEDEEDPEPKPAARQAGTKAAQPAKTRKTSIDSAESDEESALTTPPEEASDGSEKEEEVKQPDMTKVDRTNDLSESEMSEVLDEPPPKRKRQKSASTTKAKATPKAKAGKASATAPAKDLNPDEAEIKRLQGWLLKCGIRKLWHRELAPYDTPKEKIKHLKDMLKDAGMDKRYSVEKAIMIKEQRELAADLEAVKEGAERWGHGEEEEEDEEPEDKVRPKRRAAQARFVDFGDSDEDSE